MLNQRAIPGKEGQNLLDFDGAAFLCLGRAVLVGGRDKPAAYPSGSAQRTRLPGVGTQRSKSLRRVRLDDLVGPVPSLAFGLREGVAADSNSSRGLVLGGVGGSTGDSVRRVRLDGLMVCVSSASSSGVRHHEDVAVGSDSSRERFFGERRGVEEVWDSRS